MYQWKKVGGEKRKRKKEEEGSHLQWLAPVALDIIGEHISVIPNIILVPALHVVQLLHLLVENTLF